MYDYAFEYDKPEIIEWSYLLWMPIKDLRIRALKEIAAHWQRPAVCMPDLPPVKRGKCDGPLEIDHIFGGGKRDAGAKMYRAIVDRKRDLNYFRILCRKHNRQRINDHGELDVS